MPPKASEPEPGSVMAQAPIFSRVSSDSAQRSFWAIVPRDMMALAVRPKLTPMAVTMPGHQRQSSMMGTIWRPTASLSPPPLAARGFAFALSPRAFASATAFSRAIWLAKRWRFISSMPKVRISLRRMSYGGRSPCSRASQLGLISSSMNRRIMSRIIRCCSSHSIMVASRDSKGRGVGLESPAMDEQEYLRAADACLDRVGRWLGELEDVDVTAGDGLVTLEFDDGARFVLNRQAAARQIWLAAGARAWHFGWDDARHTWVDDRDGHDLYGRIAEVVG